MTTTATEKSLLRRTSAAKFLLGVLMVAAAVFLPAFAALFPDQTIPLAVMAIAGYVGGIITLGLALADLAESKGQPREYGLLIGLGLFGLIWAVVLPDRNVDREWTNPTLQW